MSVTICHKIIKIDKEVYQLVEYPELTPISPVFEKYSDAQRFLVDRMGPYCKCGNPCQWYGLIGGYSKKCIKCNQHKAKQSRESRARIKAKKL